MNAVRLVALPISLVLISVAVANVVLATRSQLSVGASFDVQGTDFGRKPTVWLDLAGKRIPLKVGKGATDTQLRATLASIPSRAHGDCMLMLRPRGAKTPFALAGLTIEVPSVDGVAPNVAAALTEVAISGNFFGSRKGRVDFGAKHGKILSWTDTEIHALVPKGLAPGMTPVVVSSKSGESAELVQFAVAP